jgi:hypothetical protein
MYGGYLIETKGENGDKEERKKEISGQDERDRACRRWSIKRREQKGRIRESGEWKTNV